MAGKSFSRPLTALDEIKQAVITYAERAAEKLHGEHQLCSIVETFLETNQHRLGYYGQFARQRLAIPAADMREIVRAALQGLETIFLPDRRYTKAGVQLAEFFAETSLPPDLFDAADRAGTSRLLAAVDELNTRLGAQTVRIAGGGIERTWQMKRESLSPAYTTHWSDIPTDH